jgi:hypothetical protein
MGDVKYGPDGTASFTPTGNQWWDGQLRLVYPPVKGAYTLAVAPPWDKR